MPQSRKRGNPGGPLKDHKTTIGKSVRKFRLAAGLSLRMLAERAQCSKGYLSLVENGHVEPSMSSLARIAESCGVRASVVVADMENP